MGLWSLHLTCHEVSTFSTMCFSCDGTLPYHRGERYGDKWPGTKLSETMSFQNKYFFSISSLSQLFLDDSGRELTHISFAFNISGESLPGEYLSSLITKLTLPLTWLGLCSEPLMHRIPPSLPHLAPHLTALLFSTSCSTLVFKAPQTALLWCHFTSVPVVQLNFDLHARTDSRLLENINHVCFAFCIIFSTWHPAAIQMNEQTKELMNDVSKGTQDPRLSSSFIHTVFQQGHF